METLVSFAFELLMLWLLLAVSAAMVVLSLRARHVERQEGLASSRKRLVAVSVVCAANSLLVLGATASALFPHRAATPVERFATEPSDPAVAAKRKALEGRKTQLYGEIDRVNVEIAKLVGPEEAAASEPPKVPWYAVDLGPLAHFFVPMLVMLGTVGLVTLGDPTTLFRSGWRSSRDKHTEDTSEALKALAQLEKHADLGQFREGLQAAGTIDVAELDKFDRLDLAFLKSYCAFQLAVNESTEEPERCPLLQTAVRDLEALLEQAPNRGEASYLLAMVHGQLGERSKSLDRFEKAAPLLAEQAKKLPFAYNESVCLLGLAEESLGRGDAEGASKLFDEVTKRRVLVDQIPTSLVKVRLLNVRRSLQEGHHDEAAKGIEAVRKLEGLDAEQRRGIEAICDTLETVIAIREGDAAAILRHTDAFLARHLPAGLPEPDEEIVEEYLESPVSGTDLRLSPQIFRAFLFLQAEARSKIVAKQGGPLTETHVVELTRPLFRALQFEVRQRDILATLGGIYYWFVPDGRKKALQWLESAATMGVEGRIARRLLEQGRAAELEHREAMEWFRSASVRFLHDPTIARSVREALIEELGRFQEFRPILLDLESSTELEPREPTLRMLRERVGYLDRMVSDLASRKSDGVGPQLHELRKDYQQLISGLDASTGRIAEIERRLMQEIGKILI
jgi:tetratricopeptide (TPR) repeat protein